MVERSLALDRTFGSLANETRRDMLRRVANEELSVTEIGKPYKMTFAAISKNLQVLERAGLIEKHRDGKLFLVRMTPQSLIPAVDYLQQYKDLWEGRLDALEAYFKTME